MLLQLPIISIYPHKVRLHRTCRYGNQNVPISGQVKTCPGRLRHVQQRTVFSPDIWHQQLALNQSLDKKAWQCLSRILTRTFAVPSAVFLIFIYRFCQSHWFLSGLKPSSMCPISTCSGSTLKSDSPPEAQPDLNSLHVCLCNFLACPSYLSG